MADYNSKYSGEQVEALLDQVASGNAGGGGGGGITVETDPIFSASPAATITEDNKAEWDSKYAKPSGGIPKSDLASGVQTSLGKADNSLQVEKFQKMDIVTVNGLAGGKSGLVYALPYESTGDEDDVLLSQKTVKTINGESIVGSGNITISGGSGEQGPQGEKGDKGDKGDTGVGVQSVKQTTISNTDGGSNVVTVTLTNGATSTFTVKNGSKGSTGTNGTNGKDGADGEDGATFTPSVDSAGNLSWSNNKGLTNPPTVNIKGPKGDKGDAGEGGGGSSGGGGVETISLSGGFGSPLIIEEMLAEKRYWLYVDSGIDGDGQSIDILGFEGDGVKDGAHIRHFYAVIECASPMGVTFNVSLSLPDVVIRWSTGTPIPIIGDGLYELSITQVIESGYAYYNGVLTSFS